MKRVIVVLSAVLIFASAQAKSQEICYKVHVRDLGDLSWACNGQMAGTTGESRRIEALWVKTTGLPRYAKVCFKTHLSNIGWTDALCEDEARYDSNGNLISVVPSLPHR
jgi:uncharacterized protein YjdB